MRGLGADGDRSTQAGRALVHAAQAKGMGFGQIPAVYAYPVVGNLENYILFLLDQPHFDSLGLGVL